MFHHETRVVVAARDGDVGLAAPDRAVAAADRVSARLGGAREVRVGALQAECARRCRTATRPAGPRRRRAGRRPTRPARRAARMSTEPSSLRARERRLEHVHRVRDLLVAADEQRRARSASSAGARARVAQRRASRRRARAVVAGHRAQRLCAWRTCSGSKSRDLGRELRAQRRRRRSRDRADAAAALDAGRSRSRLGARCRARVTRPIAGDDDRGHAIAPPPAPAQLARPGRRACRRP